MDHAPVLLQEVIKYLNIKPGKFVIDGTIDGGGHASAILEKVGPKGKLLGVDLDVTMLERTSERFKNIKNAILENGNYADLPEILEKKHLEKANGILVDLGFSSLQLAESGRGFSFVKDEPLLMTYKNDAEPAYRILSRLREEELATIITKYGEEKFARKIAHSIKEEGRRHPIRTTFDLRNAIMKAVPGSYERGRIDPATRTFQAIRIYGNDELGNLENVLKRLPEILEKNGRAVFISFHSLEDRIVKNEFRRLEKEGTLKIITKKPIEATQEEKKNKSTQSIGKIKGYRNNLKTNDIYSTASNK